MKLRPNCTEIEGTVVRIERAGDGIGATVKVQVTHVEANTAQPDFVGARLGQVLELFAAVPEELRAGARYRIELTLMGGPRAQRVVLRSARPLPESPTR